MMFFITLLMLMIWKVLAMMIELCIGSLLCFIMLIIDLRVLSTCVTLWAKGTVIMKGSEKLFFLLFIVLSVFTVMRHCSVSVVRIVIYCCVFFNMAVICSAFSLVMTAAFEAYACCWVDCVIHIKLKGFYYIMLLFCWWFCTFINLLYDCI